MRYLQSFFHLCATWTVARATTPVASRGSRGGAPEGAHAHHVIPKKFANQCQNAGLNIHDPRYGAWWPASKHLSAAKAYNDEWDDFFFHNKNPSIEQILQFGRKLASKYELQIHF